MVVKKYDNLADQTVASANNCFRALRRLFSWAIAHYEQADGTLIFSTNPVLVLARRKKWRPVKAREEYINKEDLAAWNSAVNSLQSKDYRDYFMLMILSGLRKNEAATLKWADIDFKKGVLTARNTKNRTDHKLPLTRHLRSLFESRLPKGRTVSDEEFVFPGTGGKGYIQNSRLHESLVTSESGVHFTPHVLRRTFSYAAAKVRLGDSARKALLNHLKKSDVTDAHYSPWDVEELAESLLEVQEFILMHAKCSKIGDYSNVIDFMAAKAANN